ncbi:MAG: DNA mismatch repair protein MutL (precursor) [Candidatus Tokpelaia hoelldobleri]|uniref:DNA mismatch repair protein MutL n=1 Tax=Candidatus Tokpelaia hoelldobleri TaxID=1902579 RepID=A0A1U9JWA8_9HYPH|nr:MAG: DNA mismatch repair protein MutL (precursor) [Candidatus Tokpelaia hoelldoblerii]
MKIRRLSETMINQIAAGEVVERPASVVKELVENAVDAGATRIEIATAGGGKNLVRVSDNGAGMAADELELAVSRHCTSKLSDNIHDIQALGFRGEALPSIGSVSRLRLMSRTAQAAAGAEIVVQGGVLEGPRPAAAGTGTVVEVRDLFYATPARLKFLKSERAETTAITDMVRRIAIAFPQVRFTLSGSDRSLTEFAATGEGEAAIRARLEQVAGKEFAENTVPLDAVREGVRLTGFAGIPAYNRGNSLQQFVYVNHRPVRDKMLSGAIRAAYADVIARDRYGVVALFITLEAADVDVNVHPAKADVRFRDPGLVRGLVIGGIREALTRSGIRPASSGAAAMLQSFQTGSAPSSPLSAISSGAARRERAGGKSVYQPLCTPPSSGFAEGASVLPDISRPSANMQAAVEPQPPAADYPLGAARAQIHKNYIVAQTDDSLILVDQHAAHERLVYEALKQALHSRPVPSQILLIPEIVELPEDDVQRLLEQAENLRRFGLVLERFGVTAIAVRETPAMLGEIDACALVRDLADELAEHNTADGLKAMLDYVAATMACHGSVRSGRLLKVDEMNALLRQMEAVPDSGTCNHGRPTYIELKLADIERLFGRR